MSEAIQVLVVEDDHTQREMLTFILKMTGDIRVCGIAADGLTGLELAWTSAPDLILLDLFLPGISGMELLRRYRRGGGRAKVLVTTRAAGQEVSDGALAEGADYFLVKPVNYDELVADIRMLCDGVRRRCERMLKEMGEDGKNVGFRYAARMASLIAAGRGERMKEAYIQTAIENATNYDGVEKNIRMLVKRVWTLDTLAYRRITGRTGAERWPTNTEFLAALAQAAKIPL